jgi:LPS-assembly protein
MVRTSLFVLIALLATALPARAQGATAPNGCGVKWTATSDDAFYFNNNHYRLSRDVRIDCNEGQLFADEVEVFADADRMRASGNVLFVTGTSRISADRLEFNTRTKTGTFFNASGIANIENRGIERSFFGTQEPDAFFYGETIEKLGPKTYRITKGGFTTCVQPTPRWEMVAKSVTLVLEKRAVMSNMVLKVKDVPVFYLPAMYYPINKEDRATGFLLPIYGSSDIKGQTLNNAFFWAINRSNDATFYHNFYSKTGQSFGGEYRYVQSAGSSGNMQTTVVREHDATYDQDDGTEITTQGIDSYTVTGSVQQQLPGRLRMTGNANYFSSLVAQQRYQQNIFAATNRTRNFGVNILGNWGANTISGTIDRNEIFVNDTDSTITGSGPRVTYTRSEKRIPGLPVYLGANVEVVKLVRGGSKTTDGTATRQTDDGLSRLDLLPTLRFPFTKLQFLTFNSSLRVRDTFWSESINNGVRVEEGIHRRIFEVATSMTGPVFTRIFNRPTSTYAQKLKHVIEPNLIIRRTTRFDNRDNIIKFEYVDNIPDGHTEVVYGVNSRLYAKKESAREILTVGVSQSYYSDDRASAVDPRYQSNYEGPVPPSKFSPIALQGHVSPTTTTDATVRAEYDTQFDALRSVAANGGISAGWAHTLIGWSYNRAFPARLADPITTASHYINAAATLRKPGNGWSGIYGFNYDLKAKDFLNQRIIAHYNTQCCGLAIEYQKFNFGTRAGTVGVPTDQRFNLSFTLAGIGTFSDLFGAFGGQQSGR